ncbi:uncharacterized protein LOC143613149 [Bidens hawaiensis]|uniref:uncharacterized protein LOC143613149 n=1 Tax=Bidens hawaiensis TaxID=980011 RepID=UPI004049F9E7
MRDLGEEARWPRNNKKSTSFKDKSKWCAFHKDFGHMTDDCIGLRREIRYSLSKGHYKELMGIMKSRFQDPEEIPQKVAPRPPDAQIINFITGGSYIYGTSFSSAKRHVKETKLENGERPIRTTILTDQRIITFDEDGHTHLQEPHHNSLIIILFISNHYVRRILVDGGSSVNIVQADVLKKMNIPETKFTPRSSVLVGFSRETKNTLGDIKLPIYIEGVNFFQKFCVIDNLSCCNVILGRP